MNNFKSLISEKWIEKHIGSLSNKPFKIDNDFYRIKPLYKLPIFLLNFLLGFVLPIIVFFVSWSLLEEIFTNLLFSACLAFLSALIVNFVLTVLAPIERVKT